MFKSTKKYIEKEIVTQVNKVKDETDFTKLAQKMQTLETNLSKLKDEYQALSDKEDTLLNNLQKRVEHLKHVEEHYRDTSVQTEYYEKRLWRLIIEYMLREGYIESSKMLISELNLSEFTDLDVFLENDLIVQSLKKRKCSEAIKW